MDGYSKTGPKSSKAEIRERERVQKDRLNRVLQASDEALFQSLLEQEFGVSPSHPRFALMLQIWRQQHPRG
jgi:hypothetical protein